MNKNANFVYSFCFEACGLISSELKTIWRKRDRNSLFMVYLVVDLLFSGSSQIAVFWYFTAKSIILLFMLHTLTHTLYYHFLLLCICEL